MSQPSQNPGLSRMDDMRRGMCGTERFAVWVKKLLKLCLAVFLLLAVLLGRWNVCFFSTKPSSAAQAFPKEQVLSWPLSEYPGYQCLVYFHPCVNDQEYNYNAHWLNVSIDIYHYLVAYNPHKYDDMKKYEVLPNHISSIDLHSQLYLFETKGHG